MKNNKTMTNNKQNIKNRKLSLFETFSIWFIPHLISTVQRIYSLTIRRINIGKDSLDQMRKDGEPWIYGIWHTNVLFSPYLLRNQDVYVLVSDSKDGELITRVVHNFGNKTIRGSSSKGGLKALRSIISTLKENHPVAFTPDGPRGPAMVIKEGIIAASRASGVPIIPLYYEATNQWVLNKSWDKHIIPKPFSTIVVSYGEPIHLKEMSKVKNDAQLGAELQRKFQENIDRCQSNIKELNFSTNSQQYEL